MAGLGFVRRLCRRLRGAGGPGRFVEKRQQGHRASRRLDPRFHLAYRLGLLPQSGPLFLDLLQLPGFRVLAAQPGERGLCVSSRLFREASSDSTIRACSVSSPATAASSTPAYSSARSFCSESTALFLAAAETLSPFPHPFVDVEPQQRAEHAAPVSRLRFEKPGELALRQDHGLHERGCAKPQDLGHPIGRGAHLVRQILEGAAFVALLQANHLHCHCAGESARCGSGSRPTSKSSTTLTRSRAAEIISVRL